MTTATRVPVIAALVLLAATATALAGPPQPTKNAAARSGKNGKAAPRAAVTFARDVAPIFERSCVGCHGAQSAAGGLNLATYDDLMKGGSGGPSVVRGKGKQSRLVRYLTGELKPLMPIGGAPLKPAEIGLVRRWIDAGAKPGGAAAVASASVRFASFGATSPAVAPPVTALAFARDTKTLAVGTYGQVQLWDMATGRRTRTLPASAEGVTSLTFSPDGKTLAAGGGVPTVAGEVTLFDVAAAGKPPRTLGGHTDVVYGLDFTPDGKRLVTASGDKTLRLWDVATGKPLHTLKDHADAVYGVCVSPDGTRIVSAGVDRSIKVWDAATGRPRFTLTGRAHNDTVYSLRFSPDGNRLLSASGDHSAKLWTLGNDPDTTREFRRLDGEHKEAVHAAAYSPDGALIATASADKTVSLWSGVGGGYLRTLGGAKDWVYAVAFTPDSRNVVAGTYDGTLLLWRANDGRLLRTFSTRPDATVAVAMAAAADPKKDDKPMNPEPVKVADGLSFPEGPAYDGKGAVYVSNCNADYVAKLDSNGKAIAFQAATDKFTFEKTNGMAFFEDGSLFACDQGRKAIIRIFPDGRMENYCDKHEDAGFKGPNDLAFDPAGNLYFTDPTGSDAKNPVGAVYRVAGGSRKVTKVADGLAFPNGLAFSADGKTLFLAESHRFRVLKLAVHADGTLGTPETFCQLPDNHIPDGMNLDQAGNLYVATYGPGLVTVVAPDGKVARTIKLPGADVTNVEFAGKELKTLYITEAQKGEVYTLAVDVGGLPLFRAPNNQVK